jgi:hypothetical protein
MDFEPEIVHFMPEKVAEAVLKRLSARGFAVLQLAAVSQYNFGSPIPVLSPVDVEAVIDIDVIVVV